MELKVNIFKKIIKGAIFGENWYGNHGWTQFKTVMEPEEKIELEDYSGFGFKEVLGILYVEEFLGKDENTGKIVKIYGDELHSIGEIPQKVEDEILEHLNEIL